MHTRGVNERHLTHADDAHLGAAAHVSHHFLELVADSKEIRAVDLVHLHAFGDDEVV